MKIKKLESKEELQKKKRRNQFIVGGILILVMILSTLGYSFESRREQQDSKKDSIDYNGFQFVKNNEQWLTQISGVTFAFKNNPTEVPKLTTEIKPLSSYAGKPLYISSENQGASYEIYANLYYYKQTVQRVQDACLDGKECKGNYPIKTCNDTIIVIEKSQDIEVKQDNNCVFIKAPDENLTAVTDSFLFKLMGIE